MICEDCGREISGADWHWKGICLECYQKKVKAALKEAVREWES